MALVNEIRDPQSRVRLFFDDNFPRLREQLALADGRLIARLTPESSGVMPTGKVTWRPGKPVVIPRSGAPLPYPWPLVGMAFDYRLRFLFGPSDVNRLGAWIGANDLSNLEGAQGRSPSLGLMVDMVDHINEMSFSEFDISRGCYVMALLESVARGGNGGALPPDILRTLHGDWSTSLDDALSLCNDVVANDITELANLFVATQPDIVNSTSFITNPTFVGSEFIGGADADFIADRVLIDIKTTTKNEFPTSHLYQIIGYALLDWNDNFQLNGVGVYFARQGITISWLLDEFIDRATEHRLTLETARDQFREIVGGYEREERGRVMMGSLTH